MQVFKIVIFLSLAASSCVVEGAEDPLQNAEQAGASQPPGGAPVLVTCSAQSTSSASMVTVVQPVSVPPFAVPPQAGASPAPLMDPAIMGALWARFQQFQQMLTMMQPAGTISAHNQVGTFLDG